MDVLVVDHPLARTRLTAMRDERTDSGAFRAALDQLTSMLVYEAARPLEVEAFEITTPVAPTQDLKAFERGAAISSSSVKVPLDCGAAIQEALKFDFRPGATVQFIVVAAGSPAGDKDRLASIVKAMKGRNVQTTVYAPASEQEVFQPLCANGGRFIGIRDAEAKEKPAEGGSTVVAGTNQGFDVKVGGLGGGMQLTGIYSARTRHDLADEAAAWEASIDAAAADDEEMTEYIRQLEQTRDTWDSPEASGDAIAREFERYLRRGGGEGPTKPGRDDPRR